MPDYHIGSLDEASKLLLAEGDVEPVSSEPRAIFLQSKTWTKALLSVKTKISQDTKIFTFDLEHAEQLVGLPIGQHLMLRVRDPETSEAIIRAYTPISEATECGKLHVLVKIYYDTPERKGGRMTQALDSLTIGGHVDFKGPVGKFEYLGKGLCTIAGKERFVKRFIMICGGSGITPIFQVFRAIMKDAEDPTKCLVIDGNRVKEDILCKDDLDSLAALGPDKCRLLYTLSRPEAAWDGLKGRMDKTLLAREVGECHQVGGEDLVLICGPESLEKSVHGILQSLGWVDSDILFF